MSQLTIDCNLFDSHTDSLVGANAYRLPEGRCQEDRDVMLSMSLSMSYPKHSNEMGYRMKTMSLLAAIIMLVLWTTNQAWAESEEAAVQRVITDLANAFAAFPRTKDRQSVLKFFTKDFSSVDDEDRGSLQDVEKMLTDLEMELNRGPVMIADRTSHIVGHVAGAFAWATYDEVLTIARGQVTVEDAGPCTVILRKTQTGWLYQHEHCSSSRTQQGPASQETSKLASHERNTTKDEPAASLKARIVTRIILMTGKSCLHTSSDGGVLQSAAACGMAVGTPLHTSG